MCLVCGFIYDEAEGSPDDGIPPGTRWEDVPANWSCPECGAPMVHAGGCAYCPACGFVAYRNPAPVGLAVVEYDGRLVLIRHRVRGTTAAGANACWTCRGIGFKPW